MSQELHNEASGDEDVLNFTQRMRRRLADSMVQDNKLPEDNKDRITFLAVLDGMDRQELGKQKIDAKNNSSASDRLVAQALVRVLNEGVKGRNPFEQTVDGAVRPAAAPPLTADGLDVLPGETDVGMAEDNLHTFAERTGMDLSTIAGAGSSQASAEFSDKS